jgi:primase-polymerase (primpol)-like protein
MPAQGTGMPFDALAREGRWVAWRIELRGGKPIKTPYAPDGKKAKADNPATWGPAPRPKPAPPRS